MATSAPRGQPPHTSDDQTSIVVGNACLVIVLCSVAVAGRFSARWMVKARIEADDHVSLTALFAIVGLAIEQFCLAHYGIGRDPTIRSHRSGVIIAKLQLASQITYVTAISLAKMSILFLYRRIFSLRITWFRVSWWINTSMVIIYFIWLFISFLVQCRPHPVSTLWEDRKNCNPSERGAQTTGIVNIVIDVTILIMPLPMVWALKMSRKKRIAVSGVFLLGLIGCAVSTARVIQITNSPVFNPHSVTFAIWSVVEPAVALICACLPTLRPLFKGALKLATSQSRSRGRSYRSSSQGRPWRVNQEEDGRPIRTGIPVHLNKDSTSTHVYAQDETHQSYQMDDVQPLRPKVLPERKSSSTLDAGPPIPRKDRSAVELV